MATQTFNLRQLFFVFLGGLGGGKTEATPIRVEHISGGKYLIFTTTSAVLLVTWRQLHLGRFPEIQPIQTLQATNSHSKSSPQKLHNMCNQLKYSPKNRLNRLNRVLVLLFQIAIAVSCS